MVTDQRFCVLLSIIVLMGILPSDGTTADIRIANTMKLSEYWWATECSTVGEGDEQTVFATFRKFPVTSDSLKLGLGRSITFDKERISVNTEKGKFVFDWRDLRAVRLDRIGEVNSAYSISIFTSVGLLLDKPFGVVELTCWRRLEPLIARMSPKAIQNSPPGPAIRTIATTQKQ